jgi:hypothetical protein
MGSQRCSGTEITLGISADERSMLGFTDSSFFASYCLECSTPDDLGEA